MFIIVEIGVLHLTESLEKTDTTKLPSETHAELIRILTYMYILLPVSLNEEFTGHH